MIALTLICLNYERLKTYFQTRDQEISTISGLFSRFKPAITQKLLKITFLMIQVILKMNEFEGSLFFTT